MKGHIYIVPYLEKELVIKIKFKYMILLEQPPAIRLLIIGPKGVGKTLHGRTLAKKLGLFHIQFREYLQELVIAKTKKPVISEREETQTAAEQDLLPE